MLVVQVSNEDIMGRRFNGHDLQLALNQRGNQSYLFVMNKLGNDLNTIQLINDRTRFVNDLIMDFESRLSMNGLSFPGASLLRDKPAFMAADIVHYHLIHNYLLSVLDFPDLTMDKPSVWTLHDPWAFTGHCVHPQDCKGWKTGCRPCPRIQDYFPMKHDKAGQMWNIKRQVYKNMDVDIVVSSKFMEDFVENSPLTAHIKNIHMIPFGINTADFQTASRQDARARWQIPDTVYVIAFRSEKNEFKGLKYILEMLEKLDHYKEIYLLSVGSEPLPTKIKRQYKVIELGLQKDTKILYDFYAACDVFLMPSIAESFGLMAVEAMASGKPVIVFEGTALPSVTFAPDCGIAVPQKNSKELKLAVERLMLNPEEARLRGEKGQKIANKYYCFDDYVSRHIELYEDIVNRKNTT